MAPLPTESTDRLVVHYLWRGIPSQVLYRFRAPTTLAAIISALNTFHTAVRAQMYTNWSVTGAAEHYAEGQTFSSPAAGVTSMVGTGPADPANFPDAYQVQILARSAGGRRAAWYYQGFTWIPDANLRVAATENAGVNTFLLAFINLRNAGLTTINGLTPATKPYVNLVINDYKTRQARQG